jgi:phytanoyl-CoA hydroxylase
VTTTVSNQDRISFDENGFVAVQGLLTSGEVDQVRTIYDRFISGAIEIGSLNKGDLAGDLELKPGEQASILQILAPSRYCEELQGSAMHQKALVCARQLLGDDVVMDFEMLICKRPYEGKQTPWHQDESYWLELSDTRAATCWIALDDTTADNGCMQFIPMSHRGPVLEHHKAFGNPNGRALETDVDARDAVPVQLCAGDCTFHHGRTLHYSGENRTDSWRRAYTIGFRPAAMVDVLRSRDFYHYVPDPQFVR